MPWAFQLYSPEALPSVLPPPRGLAPSHADPAVPCSPSGPSHTHGDTADCSCSPFLTSPHLAPSLSGFHTRIGKPLRKAASGQVQFHVVPFIHLSSRCPHTKALERVHWASNKRFLLLYAVSDPAFLMSWATWKAAAVFMHQTHQLQAPFLMSAKGFMCTLLPFQLFFLGQQ